MKKRTKVRNMRIIVIKNKQEIKMHDIYIIDDI